MELDLKNLLAGKALSRKDKVLLLLAAGDNEVKSVSTLRNLALENGLRAVKNWNISQVLGNLNGAVTRLPDGWTLTDDGRAMLASLGVGQASPSKVLQPTLRKYATAIGDPQIKEFVAEAVDAIEFKLFRSAVVFSWVGAVSILYEVVLKNHLAAYNAEALRRFPKWKMATSRDDLSRMKEYDFLQIINAISIFGKNTKDELEQCLKLRNLCGHPSSHSIGEHRVTAHVETLILNVFSKYAI